MENQTNTDSWDSFTGGAYLKAADLTDEKLGYVCMEVKAAVVDSKPIVRLVLALNGKEYLFDLNKTNAKKSKELGITSPSKCLGKTFFFKKVLVRNPKTNQEVDGLRISAVK